MQIQHALPMELDTIFLVWYWIVMSMTPITFFLWKLNNAGWTSSNTPITIGLKCVFSLQEIEQSMKGNKNQTSPSCCQWASVRAAGEGLKGEEKLTTYLNRLWKQFHLSPLARYQSPDGALIIKNANCKNPANLAPTDLLISPATAPPNKRPDII